MYIQINVGRNVASTPMSDENWRLLQFAVGHLLADLAIDLEGRQGDVDAILEREDDVMVHLGTGRWQGVEEESAHLSICADVAIDKGALARRMTTLDHQLALLGERYGQECIALVTKSKLVKARALSEIL